MDNLMCPIIFDSDINTSVPHATASSESTDLDGLDFSFLMSDEAKNINMGSVVEAPTSTTDKKKKTKKSGNDREVVARDDMTNPVPGSEVAEANYEQSYAETSLYLRSTIAQADELSQDIKSDIHDVRASKTLKSKYTYLTNLTSAAASTLTTKITAIRELNNSITQIHNLNLNRMKLLKLDKKDGNDDMKMMDIYSAFINTPYGTYTPPAVQDLTIGVNGDTVGGPVRAVEMVAPNGSGTLTPEQNRLRMENNPNIKAVVRYNQSTGQRWFDVIDITTGTSVPNYPRPDAFLLEDTTIDVRSGVARNRNVNAVWPLMLEGTEVISEY